MYRTQSPMFGGYVSPRYYSPRMTGGKLSEADIVRGRKVLKNQAVAGYVNTPKGERWRIVKGASPKYMKEIRAMPRLTKEISPEAAQKAFDKYYRMQTLMPRKGSPKFRSERGLKQARTYDINYSGKVNTTQRYAKYPHLYDYPGVDLGTNSPKPRGKQAKKLVAN